MAGFSLKEFLVTFLLYKAMNKIVTFVKKNRKEVKVNDIVAEIENLHWYQKPINSEDFTSRLSKDGKFYVRHKEWHNTIWIGPYSSKKDVEDIIASYVEESLKAPLNRKMDINKVHSIHIENELSFFC